MITAIMGLAEKLINPVTSLVDDLTTTEEEKAQAKEKLQVIANQFDIELNKAISERWKADMNSDSWLSKNIRPLTLAFLIVSTVLLVFIDAGAVNFIVQSHWVDMLQLVLITVIGAYFGGRSYEKVRKSK